MMQRKMTCKCTPLDFSRANVTNHRFTRRHCSRYRSLTTSRMQTMVLRTGGLVGATCRAHSYSKQCRKKNSFPLPYKKCSSYHSMLYFPTCHCPSLGDCSILNLFAHSSGLIPKRLKATNRPTSSNRNNKQNLSIYPSPTTRTHLYRASRYERVFLDCLLLYCTSSYVH